MLRELNQNHMLERKTTTNGRQPQNIKSWISQQPLIGSFSNFKLKLRGPNLNKKGLNWRRPLIEDNLKISKVEYISNHRLAFPQTSIQISEFLTISIFWYLNVSILLYHYIAISQYLYICTSLYHYISIALNLYMWNMTLRNLMILIQSIILWGPL